MVVRNIGYPKPRRIPLGKGNVNRNMLTAKQVSDLLRGRVVVEEKLDGKPASFEASHYIVFAEDMKKQHTIFYALPGRYAVFDIYDEKRGVFVFSAEKLELTNALRKGKIKVKNLDPVLFFPVPQVAKGTFGTGELVEMVGLSAYARERDTGERVYMEGIVVKPDRDLFPEEFLSGKLVRREFEEGIKTHHLRMPAMYNIINPSLEVVISLSNDRLRPSQIPPALKQEC